MKNLILESTKYSPKVVLDKDMKYFEISGMSRPENVLKFYGPIIEWIKSYLQEDGSEMVLNFRMQYFNTATSKMLLNIVSELEIAKNNGRYVEILWSYEEGDEDMKDAGEEFKEIVNIPFSILESTDDFSAD